MVDGSSLISMRGIERECTLATFVERGLTGNHSIAFDGDVTQALHYDTGRSECTRERYLSVVIGVDHHLVTISKGNTFAPDVCRNVIPYSFCRFPCVVRLVVVDINHLHLLRTCLHHYGCGIVGVSIIVTHSSHTHIIGSCFGEILHCHGSSVC